jgi:hypothetical protein
MQLARSGKWTLLFQSGINPMESKSRLAALYITAEK